MQPSSCLGSVQGNDEQIEQYVQEMREWTKRIAQELKVVGLINVQYCIKGGELYIIEANPRASRTVPFVAKAVGHPIASYGALLMSGKSLKEIGFTEEPRISHVAVKEVVLPFSKFPGADLLLGPEMRSTGMLLDKLLVATIAYMLWVEPTLSVSYAPSCGVTLHTYESAHVWLRLGKYPAGEVMGIDESFELAYAKASVAAGQKLPPPGTGVFVSVRDEDKDAIGPVVSGLANLGYKLYATGGTAAAIRRVGVRCERIYKINEGRPNASDALKNGDIKMMIITSAGDEPDVRDGKDLRREALSQSVPLITTVSGGAATVGALRAMQQGTLEQVALQEYFPAKAKAEAS
jgi:carbamoyl-phosphate synthase large subunit